MISVSDYRVVEMYLLPILVFPLELTHAHLLPHFLFLVFSFQSTSRSFYIQSLINVILCPLSVLDIGIFFS